MKKNYINIYNNLIKLTRNVNLYKNFTTQDTYSDRLIFFLFHFAFSLKIYKKNNDKKTLQHIFDYIFNQLETSIREIGHGDASINKRMKNYINFFYDILDKIENWEILSDNNKHMILSNFLAIDIANSDLTVYFDKYINYLSNNTLNSHIKGVINHKF